MSTGNERLGQSGSASPSPREEDVSARRAARAQWEKNPAGTSRVDAVAEGSPEFFREMTRTRYESQPWHPALLRAWAPRGTLLEIGCGAGTDHAILRETTDLSIAIDLARRGVALTGRRISLEGGRGIALVADGEQCPVATESVDAVYSFGVIHHTDHPERIVAEMARILRPGGSFFVAVYHRYSLFVAEKLLSYLVSSAWKGKSWLEYLAGLEAGGADQEEPPVIKLYSSRELRKMFAEAGFADLHTVTVHPYGFWRYWPRVFNRLGWYVIIRGTR